MRLGIIGIGNMGSAHCKTILEGKVPELKLTAVADLKESRRTWAKENLTENVQIFSNEDELLESDVVDAVLISVPHYSHPDITIKALEKGSM